MAAEGSAEASTRPAAMDNDMASTARCGLPAMHTELGHHGMSGCSYFFATAQSRKGWCLADFLATVTGGDTTTTSRGGEGGGGGGQTQTSSGKPVVVSFQVRGG